MIRKAALRLRAPRSMAGVFFFKDLYLKPIGLVAICTFILVRKVMNDAVKRCVWGFCEWAAPVLEV
ncbi:hypothetical protein TH30_09565 [Thalassospira profundimaris]|uniref:Uncharacterized protein n=1 Tax=Thalassospira profundimaris TaxID=502049 RepID=A0A367WXA0_9PROT|nr:hypothetical protein TH30_09565 [Thalassospira profundimaris]